MILQFVITTTPKFSKEGITECGKHGVDRTPVSSTHRTLRTAAIEAKVLRDTLTLSPNEPKLRMSSPAEAPLES
jgi:hypothetical protein